MKVDPRLILRKEATGACLRVARRIRRCTAGFSRVDLLAVLTTFFVLASVGIPSLGSTHNRSKLAVCMANQRQLVQASLMYGQDYRDAILPPTFTTSDGATIFLVGGGFWAGPSPDINVGMTRDIALDTVRKGLMRGPLWQYAKSADVYHCPGDQRVIVTKPGSNGWGYDSYSKPETMGDGGLNSIRPFRRIAEVPDPALAFLFCEEADPRGSNIGTWVLSVKDPGWVDGFGAFHDGGAQFAFLDGHVDFNRWRDPRTLKVAKDLTRGLSAFNAPGGNSKNPDFRWVYDRFRFVGWKPLP